MFGPGTGHNIVRFLDYFKEHHEHSLSYYHYNSQRHFQHSAYQPTIKFISPYSLISLIKEIRNSQDLLWIHNWTPWPILLLVLIFAKKNSVINFNVWSESIPKMVKGKSIKARFYTHFFNFCDTLQCTWFSTLNLLKEQGFKNTVMLRWGMVEEKFSNLDNHVPSAFTAEFCNRLDTDKYLFFFPKSVSGGNRHDLIVEASKKLMDAGFFEFKVFFWLGNFNRDEQLKSLEEKIKKYNLKDQISINHHNFVSHEDIHYIWSKMDCGLQILDADQLSTSFQEPQLYLKEIIASNIPSYNLFSQEFNIPLDLIENESDALFQRMKKLLEGEKTSNKDLLTRQKVFLDNYRFKTNMPKMLNYFSEVKN